MGFVEFFYTSVVDFFEGIQQTQFGAVASGVATTGQLLATMVVVFALIAAASGRARLDVGDVLKLIVTVTLVALFMQNWAEFNKIVTALISFFNGLRDSFFANVIAGGEGTFLQTLDETMRKALESATKAAGSLDIAGTVQNAFVLLIFALFSALALISMVITYALLTIAMALAPVAIMCILSQKTVNYFEKWLDFLIMSMLFPVVIAAILGTFIVMMQQAFVMATDDPTIGTFFPVFAAVLTGKVLLVASPFIVASLTGSFQLGSLAGVGARSVGAGAASAGGALLRGLGALGRGSRTVATDTAGYIQTQRSQGNEPYAIADRSTKLQRIYERQQRFAGLRVPK